MSVTASLDSLVVPAAFARHDEIGDTTSLAELNTWKVNTELSLNQLDPLDVSALPISGLADLVRILAPLTAVARWSSPAIRSLASALLARIPASDKLIAHVLTHIVKPLFAPTPHPRLHITTARILPRPADVQDTYNEQPWKEHPGLDEVIRWCLLNTKSATHETSWPLFLPPIMTFLDDYQVPYKLLGIRLVSDMLTWVPVDLLLRTGVDALMFTSLTNSLSYLGDKSTPEFIRSAVMTTLQLIDLTTPSMFPSHSVLQHDSELRGPRDMSLTRSLSPSQSKSLSTRFSRLSTLLSSSLLGTVIMYTPTFLHPMTSAPDLDPFTDLEHMDTNTISIPEPSSPVLTPRKQSFNPTLIAAAQSLPPILLALGICGVRFLKGVIPVLAEWLSLPLPIVADEIGSAPDDNEETSCHDSKPCTADLALHLASLSSLSILFHTCAPRIGGWATTIVDALARCWVGCLDIEGQVGIDTVSKGSVCILRKQLKETAVQLAEVCPSVTKVYAILLAFDASLFEGLVGES